MVEQKTKEDKKNESGDGAVEETNWKKMVIKEKEQKQPP